MGRPITNRPTREFIASSVLKDPRTGCWIWKRYVQTLGYGQAEVGGTIWLAHRLSWTVHQGVIPKGMLVLHRCDTPRCVNPEHLFLGTHKDNTDDAIAKGRFDPMALSRHSRKNRVAKLTDDMVRAIRAGGDTDKGFALRFGVSRNQVCAVRNGKAKTLVD